MKLVILGCGEFGAKLAEIFEKEKVDITIIDFDSDAFRKLGKEFKGNTIVGSGLDREVLEKANIDAGSVFVAASGKDTTNLMAAQIVKRIFNVPRIIVCVDNPTLAGAYKELDLETFCPTEINARIVKDIIEKKS
ncbi:MAG: NAD-binding protein [Elusimicrobiota bacterium]